MGIFTSMWFWFLVVGILLVIGGIVAWIVSGKADILAGLLIGAGAALAIAGLLVWIFGRGKSAPPPPTMTPTETGLYPINTSMPTMTGIPTTTTTTSTVTPTSTTGNLTQQQLLQLLAQNPQLLNTAKTANML